MEPPKWIVQFIRLYCPPQLAESIVGDIWEQYLTDRERHSRPKAMRRLLWNAVRFIRPGIVLRNSKIQFFNKAMLRINLLLALRNMRKHTFYSSINILGLAMSILFSILIYFYVENTIRHDSFHDEHESIFRITKKQFNRETDELIDWNCSTSNQFAQDIRNEVPSIQYISRVLSASAYIKKGSQTFSERIRLVDSDFFQMFSFPVMEGNGSNPLADLSAVVISPETATKYFGTANPIGQPLELIIGSKPYTFIVTAVIDPVEELNSLPFEVVIPFEHVKKLISDLDFLVSYNVSFLETFVKLNANDNVSEQEELITDTFTRMAKLGPEDNRTTIQLQPVSKLYWWSDQFPNEGETTTYNPDYVYILIGLGVLVLIIAVLNFIMLTSSQSFSRIKEFGVRKTMGALKRQLSGQLLMEVLLLAFMASIIALLTSYYFIPVFNALTNAQLRFQMNPEMIVFLLLLILLISFVSSALSSGLVLKIKTTQALKGSLSIQGSGITQNLMVVIQFTLCIGLIIGTLAFKSQMNFVSNKSLGFEKNELVEIALPSNVSSEESQESYRLIKNELDKQTDVVEVAAVMTSFEYPWTEFDFEQEDESQLTVNFNLVSPNYLKTMGIELLEGRDFREDDSGKSIIVNESLVRKMGWENPIGKQIPGRNFSKSHEIIGVVKDFHFNSLHDEVAPLVLVTDISYIQEGITGLSTFVWPPQYFTLSIKLTPGNAASKVETIENAWQASMGDVPFNLKFVNSILNDKYLEERRYSSIINYAAGFSLFIAWLGLLALTRLVIQKRFKEMGIRKVLGSTPWNIMLLVSKKFLLLIGLATVIASPIAWWLLDRWLNDFAYKIALSPWLFLLAGLGVVTATFISISIQAMKVVNMNPSEALRME